MAIATGIGVEALGSILNRIAFGETVSDEEIVEQMRRAVDESGIAELLTTSKHAQEQLVRLASWQRHLKYVIETGNQKVIQDLAEQYQMISYDVSLIRRDLEKLATREQSEEMKQVLYRILYLLEVNSPRSYIANDKGRRDINPFIVGPAIRDSAHFYGRENAIRFVVGRVGAIASQSVSIVGERRVGKSSLMWQIINNSSVLFLPDYQYIFVYLDLSGAASRNNKSFMSSLRRELFRKQLPSWSEFEDGDLMAMSYACEQLEAYRSIRLAICLDEFEYVNAHPDKFDGLLETLRAEAQLGRITIITASHTSLATLCAHGRIETSPFYNIFTEFVLGLLDKESWSKLVKNNFSKTGISLSQNEENFILECAGQHAFFSQMVAYLLWEQKVKSSFVDYEALGVAFEVQAEPHFEYIWRHRSDTEKEVLKGQMHSADTRRRLINRGLLTRTGEPFSRYFERFVKTKK